MANFQSIKAFTVAAIAGSLFLMSCSKTLDAKKVGESILSEMTKQGASSVKSVICPTDVTPVTGKEFECIGVLDSGNGVSIAVTQQDAQGNVTWKVSSVRGLLNMTALQSEVEQALKKEVSQAKVDCGLSFYRLVKPGETFECQLIKREPKSERDSATASSTSEQSDSSKPIQTTESAIDTSKTTDAAKATDPKPSEFVQVTIQPSGDVNWQRIIKVPETKVATTSPTEKPTESNPTLESNKSDEPKASAPAAKSAEDFLNQPGANDDFE
jgi:hypothetical protein